MEYLKTERYDGFTRDQDGGVTWNGHHWPKDYTCMPINEFGRRAGSEGIWAHLTCGHTIRADSRFCPMCGRAIVGNRFPRKLEALAHRSERKQVRR